MSFRSTREARERFLQLARRAEESAPLFYRVRESAGANPAGALTGTWNTPGIAPANESSAMRRLR